MNMYHILALVLAGNVAAHPGHARGYPHKSWAPWWSPSSVEGTASVASSTPATSAQDYSSPSSVGTGYASAILPSPSASSDASSSANSSSYAVAASSTAISAAAYSAVSSVVSIATTTVPMTVSSSLATASSTGKPVIFHYMLGGMTEAECKQDITDAKNLGADAFAINFGQFSDWGNKTIDYLFDNAVGTGFKILFSFDMSGSDYFQQPSEYAAFVKDYIGKDEYFKVNGKAVITTFGGESVTNDAWSSFKSSVGGNILVIPGQYNIEASSTYFSNYAALDGVFNWNSWPWENVGKTATVLTTDDEKYQKAANSTGKLFMMGMSPIQWKQLDKTNNWYRRGEANLEIRFGQVLSLQPDMLEIQTWNDGGESHYMGNLWPEPYEGTTQGTTIQGYTNGYNHTGYWQILGSFIQAWKRGDTTTDKMYPTNNAKAQGTFWHHTMLVDGDCSKDTLGKSNAATDAADLVTGVVLVAEGETGYTVTATAGSTNLGSKDLLAGFNSFTFDLTATGNVTMEVKSGSTTVISGTGPIAVTDSADLCNFNFQVVGLK